MGIKTIFSDDQRLAKSLTAEINGHAVEMLPFTYGDLGDAQRHIREDRLRVWMRTAKDGLTPDEISRQATRILTTLITDDEVRAFLDTYEGSVFILRRCLKLKDAAAKLEDLRLSPQQASEWALQVLLFGGLLEKKAEPEAAAAGP